jgi:hypothetical protein
MRAKEVINRYRGFAARTHLVMTAFALGLILAIIVLMIVSAVPSQASFLVAEARNLVGVEPSGDWPLLATVVVVFLAVLVIKLLDRKSPAD